MRKATHAMDADVIVVGAGLAGLVAAHELTSRGRRVALVDQENAANLGGQAFWSFGGLFLVDSPSSAGSASRTPSTWPGATGRAAPRFDRTEDEDSWAVRWARAYVEFAAGEKRAWLAGHGITFVPTVGWAERGDLRADGHGNSVPRFHVAWGTGTGVVEPFVAVRQAGRRGRAADLLPPAPRRRAGRRGRRRRAACAARSSPPTTPRAASPPTATRSASSS